MAIKTMWIKDEYIKEILDGRKTIEVRVGYDSIRKLRTGDQLLLNARYPYQITRIAYYRNFHALIEHESVELIAPGQSSEACLKTLRAIYPPKKEAQGVVALEIAPVIDNAESLA